MSAISGYGNNSWSIMNNTSTFGVAQPIAKEAPAAAPAATTLNSADDFMVSDASGGSNGSPSLSPFTKSSKGANSAAELNLWREQEAAAMATYKENVIPARQGAFNSCGTTSLAMILGGKGIPVHGETDFHFVDEAIRPWNIGAGTPTSPGDIVKYARAVGMQAEQYSKCDLEDVARQLRSGHNVTVLLDYESPFSESAGVHYVNVIGTKNGIAYTSNPMTGRVERYHHTLALLS